MTVNRGYVLQNGDYPAVPPKSGYVGSWKLHILPIIEDVTITALYRKSSGGGVVMSDEQPVDAEASAGAEIASLPDHDGQLLVSTQTVQHDYITQNGKVVRETIITDDTVTAVIDFIYDESGRPFALSYTNGTSTPDVYYYVLNLQGDVVGLVNSSGGWVAQYTYNAWGEILSSSGTMAEINPLRYRGYYYDTETGFYYLQSRYYDPTTHRFINADSYTSTGQGVLGTNMFAYCQNSLLYTDETGEYPIISGMMLTMCVLAEANTSGVIKKQYTFYSMDDAAAMAGIIANTYSAKTKHEFICGVYEIEVGNRMMYTYGEFFEGEDTYVFPHDVFEERDKSSYRLVALLHSHPYCTYCECNNFSIAYSDGTLYGDAWVVEKNKYPLYLAAPNGQLKLLKTAYSAPTTIRFTLPVDTAPYVCKGCLVD